MTEVYDDDPKTALLPSTQMPPLFQFESVSHREEIGFQVQSAAIHEMDAITEAAIPARRCIILTFLFLVIMVLVIMVAFSFWGFK